MSPKQFRQVCVIFAFVCAWVPDSPAQGAELFSEGNKAYAAGNFDGAITHYEEAARAGQRSGALFYNLGNARYRSGDLGRAILNYERALALELRHPEAEANLRLARDKGRALELKRTWIDRLFAHSSAAQFSIIAAAAFWTGAFALAGLLLSRRRSAGRVGLAVFCLMALAAAVAGLYSLETGRSGRALAVVTGVNIEARLATADNAGSVLALPPGSEIDILSTRGDWIYAVLPNDLRGWIPATGAERVRL